MINESVGCRGSPGGVDSESNRHQFLLIFQLHLFAERNCIVAYGHVSRIDGLASEMTV
jgi:hypothetical protein